MTNSTKAALILWLTEMKQKGKARIQSLHKQFEKGEVEAFHIQEARKRYNCILDLLQIFQACPMEPGALLKLLEKIKLEKSQQKLFSGPKNPN